MMVLRFLLVVAFAGIAFATPAAQAQPQEPACTSAQAQDNAVDCGCEAEAAAGCAAACSAACAAVAPEALAGRSTSGEAVLPDPRARFATHAGPPGFEPPR